MLYFADVRVPRLIDPMCTVSIRCLINVIHWLAKTLAVAYAFILCGVFVQIVMPKSNGIVIAKELRRVGYHNGLIAMTANTATHDLVCYESAGFDGVVGKPFNQSDLESVLILGLKASTNSLLPPPTFHMDSVMTNTANSHGAASGDAVDVTDIALRASGTLSPLVSSPRTGSLRGDFDYTDRHLSGPGSVTAVSMMATPSLSIAGTGTGSLHCEPDFDDRRSVGADLGPGSDVLQVVRNPVATASGTV
jgi:CheY-like chemotaxis protein